MPFAVSNTAYGIIRDAMMDAGLLQEGDEPNSEQLATYMRRLCDIINLWQTQGLKLFLQKEVSVTLTASVNSYTLNPAAGVEPHKHLRVLQGRIEGPNLDRRILNALSWQEWNTLSQSSEGAITGYFVDKQTGSLNVKFWCTPDAQEATNTVVLLVQEQAENPFNLVSDVAFPQEWRIALRWGLANDICTGQPDTIMSRCFNMSELYKSMLENWDVEDTPTSFAPDFRGTYYSGRFR